jgi:hypothetical protein
VRSTGDVAAWSSPAWLAEATDWIDEQLIAHGLERTGRVEQPHLRPPATALRTETSRGPVWLKAPGPGTASEVALYAILARVVPDAGLTPLAIDRERAWVLLPDGGPTIGERLGRDRSVEARPAARLVRPARRGAGRRRPRPQRPAPVERPRAALPVLRLG